jgi:5-dehydro-2-deoxygluconokinase
MPIGFPHPLYILPFDQRESIETKMFGWEGHLTTDQTAQIADAKTIIYDGFRAAIAQGAPREHAAILVDEQFGIAILRDATDKGFMTACPAEKSGQKEFDFEYGEQFARHIESINPTFCKVLVRYNPEGDKALNQRQTARLKRLSDYLHDHKRMFMVELYVEAEPDQLQRAGNDEKRFDLEQRPALTVRTVEQLQDAGVEPDVWKVQGMDKRSDGVNLVAAARRGGRGQVGCIILGGGEDEQQVRRWLTTVVDIPGFIGFAVGRTTFWNALTEWRANQLSRQQAVSEIARRYREWVDIFENASHRG